MTKFFIRETNLDRRKLTTGGYKSKEEQRRDIKKQVKEGYQRYLEDEAMDTDTDFEDYSSSDEGSDLEASTPSPLK